MNFSIILSDGQEIELSEIVLPMHLVKLCEDKAEAQAVSALLTVENLSRIAIQENGETLLEFEHCFMLGEQYVYNDDGSCTAHFYLDGLRVTPVPDEATAEDYEAALAQMGVTV